MKLSDKILISVKWLLMMWIVLVDFHLKNSWTVKSLLKDWKKACHYISSQKCPQLHGTNPATGEVKCVQYKNTTLVDGAYNQWKTTHSIPGRNLDRADAKYLDNVEVIVPKGSAQNASQQNRSSENQPGINDEFKFGKIKVDSVSPDEMKTFLKENYPRIKKLAECKRIGKVW